MRFDGTRDYVATDDLKIAVNAAVTLERPLLVKGEPGTGKTELARQISQALGLRMIEWNVKSTTRAQQGLYEYDAVSRLRDSQLGDARVHDVGNYIRKVNSTNLNQASSRSHCIFTLNVKGKNLATLTEVYSKIHLVDLAGSERVSRSMAEGIVLT